MQKQKEEKLFLFNILPQNVQDDLEELGVKITVEKTGDGIKGSSLLYNSKDAANVKTYIHSYIRSKMKNK